MTNDENQMTKKIGIPKSESGCSVAALLVSDFGLDSDFGIRIPDF